MDIYIERMMMLGMLERERERTFTLSLFICVRVLKFFQFLHTHTLVLLEEYLYVYNIYMTLFLLLFRKRITPESRKRCSGTQKKIDRGTLGIISFPPEEI
jgi:hypothetical protein